MIHFRPAAAVAVLILAPSLLCSQTLPSLIPETLKGELAGRIDSYMSRSSAFGLSGTLLVAHHGEVILHRAYGLADRTARIRLETDMPMLIGSLGKQFTATAILKLESQGRLRTSDSLGRFFPDAPADKKGITLHQLLTHTAGLPYLPSGSLFQPTARDQVMREMLALPLDSRPGEAYSYSSPGYTLLAGVVEIASSERFEQYLTRELFAPAGMTNTGFEGDSVERHRAAPAVHSYSSDNDEGSVRDFPYSDKFIGAGTVISTAGDLYRWEQAVLADRILPAAYREKLFTPYVVVQGPTSHAYGWNVITTPRNTRMIAHGGDIGGYNSEYRRYADEDLTVIFTSNARQNGAGYRQAIMNPISIMVNGGAPFAEPPAVVPLDSAGLESLAGRYSLQAGGNLTAWVEGDRLMIGADSRESIAVLSGAGADTSSMRQDLERRAIATLEGLAAGDSKAFEENLHPSIPVADMRDAELVWWSTLRDSLGRVERVELVGSAMLSPMAAHTYHRITFQRGSVFGMYGWGQGRIVGIQTDLAVALATPFLPEAEGRVASYDIFTGRTLRASFGAPVGGSAPTLTVHTGRGDVVARRVEG